MNERQPSGYTPDYDAYAYDAYSTGAYQAVSTAYADDTSTGTYAYIPQQQPEYGQQPQQGYGQQYDPYESYDHTQQHQYGYDPVHTHSQPQAPTYGHDYAYGYDPYAYGTGDGTVSGTGTHTTTASAGVAQPTGATYYDTGTYDAQQFASYGAYEQQPQAYPQQPEWDSGAYPAYGYGDGTNGDTGGYEQVAAPYAPDPAVELDPYADVDLELALEPETAPYDPDPVAERHDYAADEAPAAARSRRRKPAKRSALLTVAVPSVAVMGVAAVGAAAVTGVGMASDSTAQASSSGGQAATNAPTSQLDRQLAGLSHDADDFATRASRAQERVDLKDRQAAAKKAKDAAAARKEALRPKFVLPVKQKGLSAYFGQAGVNWMALHTGIDFPVIVGTPVVAVTDGTVRTQWNNSYGNMAIVTAPDGTETWYCHLSSTKIRSGSVKAGTVIAYSGNTGNTTGPHLHLEVRPHGGAPIDPLPWLLAHGLDPR